MHTETAIYAGLNLIDGEWVEAAGGQTFTTRNPAVSGEVVARFPAMEEADAIRAIEAAQRAAPGWRRTAPSRRAAILYKAADLLEANAEPYAEELTREEGKPLGASRMEVLRSAQTLRYYASEGLNVAGATLPSDDPAAFVYTKREPLGVVSVITPWNFPISIPARKIAPALATGNTVVFKPASDTPLIAMRLAEALHSAGLPAGVLNFVTGSSSRIGGVLVSHPAVRAITFTGSTGAGEQIKRGARLATRLQLELGGKNPLIVLADADLDQAAELAVKGGFELTGQACTGTSRVLVMDEAHDAFVERLVARTRALSIGSGLVPTTEIGPLANRGQLEQVLEYIAVGQDEGARLVYGGERLEQGALAQGYYVRPAIFTEVEPSMRIAREEIFGPVIAVLRIGSLQEALQCANDVEYGLSAAICTREADAMHYFIDHVHAGVVKVNRPTTGNAVNAPFGGWKQSGTATYRESGRAALDFYLQEKTIYHGVRLLEE
ncbi:aldehyde dehydrogenase family protein [Paenibacillus sp. IB182496]|uniref:Aldehyde dehydrogenase family protein n=1 Tax=Paenibacillus sabuli TaxID=2772509 RepID=A0A927BQM6_9BACL|nr:aldehyde dehydrogenase family protein [Paenibacillus sabuli]MBD2844946.1 aldehyde dehydrogenase family protein [Paenibacillus sabuli]